MLLSETPTPSLTVLQLTAWSHLTANNSDAFTLKLKLQTSITGVASLNFNL